MKWNKCRPYTEWVEELGVEEAMEIVMSHIAAELWLGGDAEMVCSEGEDWERDEMDSYEDEMTRFENEAIKIIDLVMPERHWAIQLFGYNLEGGEKVASQRSSDIGGTVYTYFRLRNDS